MAFISRLQLMHFRCYEQVRLADLSAGAVVLYGPNGAGKTNVLEAISMLSPGRGLRGAKVVEMQQKPKDAERGWAVSAEAETPYGLVKLGTGRDPRTDKRLIRINGESAKAQSALAEYLSCVWLTPQMDRLFLDAASSRRRFLDRLVFAFDPSHAGRITRYENAMRQRSKILQEYGAHADPVWLNGLEDTMAETGVAIAAARLHFVERLQQACEQAQAGESLYFPLARLRAAGTLEELVAQSPALEVEDMFRYQLGQTRPADIITGGAATGPHKSDLVVTYADKDMTADQCSTGEQKALLIGMILAHARLIAVERGAPPILLLDEVSAHLDEDRRAALYDLLLSMGGQVWLTGTDEALFRHIRGSAAFFRVENAHVYPPGRSEAA